MAGCDNSLASIWPDDLYFVVPALGSPYLNDGGQIMALPLRFEGWKCRLIRTNVPVDFEEQVVGDPYFTQDTTNNTITVYPDATTGDKFMVWAYKPAS